MNGGKGSKTRVPLSETREARIELRSSLTAIGIILALIIFIYIVQQILLPFVVAGIIAYIFTPLVDWLHRRLCWPRWIFATAVLLILMIITAAVFFLAWPSIYSEFAKLGGDLHGTVESFLQRFIGSNDFTLFGEKLNAKEIADKVVGAARQWVQGSQIITVAALGFAGMFGYILSWVLLGYFLIDAPKTSKGLFWLVPPHHRPFVHRVWADLNPVLHRYFVGVGCVVIYAATVAYIGLGLFLHLQHAVLLAILTGFLEVIPVVGPAASAIIAGLVAVEEAKSSWSIIAYVIYAIILRVSIDEFFGPIVLGRAAYIRPVMVIFCFLTGGILFGIMGVILAIPVALTVKASLYELYKDADQESELDPERTPETTTPLSD
ncbi:MAG TPA: AI-2E family transporter [Pseudolabrys sp.]|jgi:predicted PurR-regulated permease PerM|nr:AI-2E family transporter [Pseudolabrys sp.]